jgi:diaminohydroxyphosphoribosylaminopyrimidine deaminase/5-amino-6-(5-phosphoribosylamino)uracil reductase
MITGAAVSSSQGHEDERWMRVAIRIGRRGRGRVAPNPAVGCVLVRDGRLIARGWTQPGGRPHAEAVALARAGAAARGCTAYVSLEPCAHHGQSPPCAEALISAGVARVVIAAHDPDPRVDGRGARLLREAGIDVREGVLAAEADADLAGFKGRVETGRPWVTLKLATTLDGQIATASGESKWITGAGSRHMVHALRAQHDAILTGVGTVLADDPMLTCRLPGMANRSPVRVVLDSRLSTPVSSAVVATARDIKTVIIATRAGSAEAERALVESGAEVVRVDAGDTGLVAPDAALKVLGDRGTTRVFVEAGGKIATSFLAVGRVDEVIWFRAPMLIGGDGIASLHSLSIAGLDDAPRFERVETRTVGEDLVETYRRRP